MKLRGKFNSMLLLVFGLALGASGYFSHRQLNDNARAEVLSNASVLMETILSARTWAVNEVGPNLRETGEDEEKPGHETDDYAVQGKPSRIRVAPGRKGGRENQ